MGVDGGKSHELGAVALFRAFGLGKPKFSGLFDLAGNLSELLADEPGVIGHDPFLLERDFFLLAVLARDFVGEIIDDGLVPIGKLPSSIDDIFDAFIR
ncbi:MAG: hypothetical protein LKJ31_07320 [Atopobiaceae bacterium]|nr:hypothetical protein [Atopobiaceae bacterium]